MSVLLVVAETFNECPPSDEASAEIVPKFHSLVPVSKVSGPKIVWTLAPLLPEKNRQELAVDGQLTDSTG